MHIRVLRLVLSGLMGALLVVSKQAMSGLSYDALHGSGNFAIMLLLYRPLRKALRAAKRQIGY